MRLQYDKHLNAEQDLIVENARHWRVELFVRPVADSHWALLALSGIAGKPAELSKLQGPYESLAQACAARSAIASELLKKDFTVIGATDEVPCIWALQAQRALRTLNQAHDQHRIDYRFDPDQVLADPLSQGVKHRDAQQTNTNDVGDGNDTERHLNAVETDNDPTT